MTSVLKQLNHRPLVVASLDGRHPVAESARKAAHLGADLVELRLDTFSAHDRKDAAAVVREARKTANRPVIATVRSAKEQGPKPAGEPMGDLDREILFQSVIAEADLVDVELDSSEALTSVLESARRLKKKTILSHHDFHGMISDKDLQTLVKKFKALEGDILKVAATPKDHEEIDHLLDLCAGLTDIDRAFIAMGEQGAISRVAGFAFGSCLTYGFVDKSVAPGQVPLEDLVRYCRFFYPPRRTHRHN